MRLGISLNITRQNEVFRLSNLFSRSEPGFTFEPWDMTTLYQDRAGTTPVTAVGQSVGYRRDKSGRGNHEVAINDAARGVYGREPKGGARNRLTYSNTFSNTAWAKTRATVTDAATVAPDGTTTASKLVETATTGAHYIGQSGPIHSETRTFSVWLKAAERNWAVIQLGSNITFGLAYVNLSTGEVSGATGGYTVTATLDPAGNGWYKCVISGTSTSSVVSLIGAIYASTGSGVLSYTGDGTSGIYMWRAQVETGATATTYQAVVSQYDITEAGVPSCYYVQTDGVDDAYVTPTITPGTDKAQVFMALKKLGTGATAQIIAEMSVTRAANNGAFTVGVPGSVAGAGAFLVSRGTVDATAQVTTGYTPPTHVVLSGLTDISGDVATLLANGSQIAQAVTDQGTGNFLAYPAYLYARGGTTQPFNGRDYGHVVRFGPNLDAATIARVESLLARNTPEVTL